MTQYAYSVYESVVSATSSELILFFVILFIFLGVALIPLYTLTLRKRKEERTHEREREQQIIEVIKENSNVISGLKTTLEITGRATTATLERVHTRIDEVGLHIKEISITTAEIRTKHTNLINNLNEMASKLNKILLIVDRNSATVPRHEE